MPAPDQMKAGIIGVFDRAAATYDQVGLEFFGHIGHQLVRHTDPQPGGRVLDLGCGRGASALPAARAVGPHGGVVATDLAPAMVDSLRQQATDIPWLTAELGDAEQPPSGPWDVIQASLVLFFLPNLSQALHRYRAALAPQGRLGFTWFGRGDDSWADVHSIIRDALPADRRPPDLPRSGPFSSVEAQHSMLAEHGFGRACTETFRVELSFRDPDQWWAWSWSQGQRHLLEQLDAAGRLESTRQRVDAVLEQRLRAGTLRWWTDVHCTVAQS